MIIDKEYPATHSMSTAWYIVDDDDNVGIMKFDDNGPVPCIITPHDYCDASELFFGEGFSEDMDKCGGIQLNPNQLNDILGNPIIPQDEDLWFDCIIKIDINKKPQFFQLLNDGQITLNGCISEELGLYKIDAYECTTKDNSVINNSPLDIMIKSGIIKCVYRVTYLSIDYDDLDDQDFIPQNFNYIPYYIYLQSYSTNQIQKRINVPYNPVKLSQIAPEQWDKILKIPGRFKDKNVIQIAQWYPSYIHGYSITTNYGEYILLPIENGEFRYILTHPFNIDFKEYCHLNKTNNCHVCNSYYCSSFVEQFYILSPTVLIITSPGYTKSNLPLELIKHFSNKIQQRCYIPRFPRLHDGQTSNPRMTKDALIDIFKETHNWLDKVVEIVNPRVILIDDNACDVFETIYNISNHDVSFNHQSYPIYKFSEIGENIDTITDLANLPYQGIIFKKSYTEDEIRDLKGRGLAHD